MCFVLEVGEDVLFCRHPVIYRTIRDKTAAIKEKSKVSYHCVGFYESQEYVQNTRQFNPTRVGYFDRFLTYFENIFKLPQGSVMFGDWIEADMTKIFLLPLASSPINDVAKDNLKTIFPDTVFTQDELSIAATTWAFYSYFLAYQCYNQETLVINYHTAASGIGYVLYQHKGPMFPFVHHVSTAFEANNCKFIFTLHQSCLGEQFAKDHNIDPVSVAKELGLEKYFLLEKTLVCDATLFTAVSPQMAAETKHVYGIAPHRIVYNGINSLAEKGEADDSQLNYTHKYTKGRIQQFLKYHFYGKLDLRNTLTFFTAGRDYQNDGFDLLIDAIANLNKRMKDPEFVRCNPNIANKNIVCFILHEAPHKGLNINVLKKMVLMQDAYAKLQHMRVELHQNLVRHICSTKQYNFDKIQLRDLCTEKELLAIKNIQYYLAQLKQSSPVCTHEVDPNHPLLQKLQQSNLLNADEDYCKIVWIPEKINDSSLIELNFREFVRGCNLGLFTGLYKPFSYKGFECMCNGTASVISNTHGVGSYILEKMSENSKKDPDFIDRQQSAIISSMSFSSLSQFRADMTVESWKKLKSQKWQNCCYGVQVLNREQDYYEQVVSLADLMIDYLKLSRYERLQLRNTMTRNCGDMDWMYMIDYYLYAYDYAMMR